MCEILVLRLSKVHNGELVTWRQYLRNGRDKRPMCSCPERECCCENESPLGSVLWPKDIVQQLWFYKMSHSEFFSLAYLEKPVWISLVLNFIRWLSEILFRWMLLSCQLSEMIFPRNGWVYRIHSVSESRCDPQWCSDWLCVRRKRAEIKNQGHSSHTALWIA